MSSKRAFPLPMGGVPAEKLPRAVVAGIFRLLRVLLGMSIEVLLAAVGGAAAGVCALEDGLGVICDFASFSGFLAHYSPTQCCIPAAASESISSVLPS